MKENCMFLSKKHIFLQRFHNDLLNPLITPALYWKCPLYSRTGSNENFCAQGAQYLQNIFYFLFSAVLHSILLFPVFLPSFLYLFISSLFVTAFLSCFRYFTALALLAMFQRDLYVFDWNTGYFLI